MSDKLSTIEIDLDDDMLELIESHFEATILKGYSEASLSVWRQKDMDLPQRLGETLLNEFFMDVIQAAIDRQDDDEI